MKAILRQVGYVAVENPLSAVGFAILVILVFLAIFGPLIAPYDPLAPLSVRLGTDQLGRDILSRLIDATRLDLGIAFAAVLLAFVFGTGLGLLAGYYGGWWDRIIGRLTDTLMAFPLFVLAMGIVAALGNSLANIVYATAIINLPLYARLVRTETNVRRNAGYVEAARLAGNSDLRIMLGHILPNILPLMAVQTSLTLGYAILNAAGLSFIGLGVQPPTPEWGIMVSEGASFIVSNEWWVALFPGLVLMIAVFCFNLMGDGLRDILDPRKRT
jgi:peptide/nickel transport system permease protein